MCLIVDTNPTRSNFVTQLHVAGKYELVISLIDFLLHNFSDRSETKNELDTDLGTQYFRSH